MKTTFPLILAWICILTAAVEEKCRWTKVDKEEDVNFNWDSHILEIKTEEITSRSRTDKQLEVVFSTLVNSAGNILKMKSFYLTQDMNGYDEILNFDIMLTEEKRHSWIKKPLGELRWTIKKNEILNLIQVFLVDTLVQHFDITTTEEQGFQFGSEDTMSLSYRVTPIGDDDCVKPGNIFEHDALMITKLVSLMF